ncbi:hypothetical protein [Vibrio phage VP41s3]|nr:hypothetical protein [Vibrio phage VP41s3]
MGSPYRMEQEIKLRGTQVTLTSGVMGSGKTAALINAVEQLEAKKIDYLIIKPELDTRTTSIWSRDGRERPCETVGTQQELLQILDRHKHVKWLFVDEAQFFNPDFIQAICQTGNYHGIEHICFYSLQLDYLDNVFPAWKEITRYADKWYGLQRMCEVCGKSYASHNVRLSGGDSLFEVGTDNYKSMCSKCKRESEEKRGQQK